MQRLLIVGLTGLALAGCAAMTPQQQAAFQQQMAASQPHCVSTRQCQAAWSAARNWVTNTCGMKIQTMTDTYIETYNSPEASTDLACRVTIDPDPRGGYNLSVAVSCGNLFGCVPDAHKAALAFNNAVSGVAQQFAGQ